MKNAKFIQQIVAIYVVSMLIIKIIQEQKKFKFIQSQQQIFNLIKQCHIKLYDEILQNILIYNNFDYKIEWKKQLFIEQLYKQQNKMFDAFIEMQRDRTNIIANLELKNQQLVQDNYALANEIYRLRQIISYYEKKNAQFMKADEYHIKQLKTMNQNKNDIIQRIQKSDTQTVQQINNNFKQLKKQVFYKKMETMEAKYQKKNALCQQLMGFKDKIQRLRNTWENKKINKGQNNLQSLFRWVYNQIVKAKGSVPSRRINSQNKPRKNQNSKKNENINQNFERGIKVDSLNENKMNLCLKDQNLAQTGMSMLNSKI